MTCQPGRLASSAGDGGKDLAALETDVLAGFLLARAAAGLSDATIASDVGDAAGATVTASSVTRLRSTR